uniref:SOCS box domain-containing protein n=1 Tax=Leptobrachium leishanense TaxID=445787 RepID=A0A8C5PLE7_9ANUR
MNSRPSTCRTRVRRPDHPVTSQFVQTLKSSLALGDEDAIIKLLRSQVKHVDAIIEFSNDDWMKEPSAWIPPQVLMGLWTLEYTQELTSPLCITCSRGYTECVRYLLHRRADANAAPGGRAPLHEACAGGHKDCVQLLLQYGANSNQRSDDGLSPLHYCDTHSSLRCASLLLQQGALVNQVSEDTEDTSLHVAAQLGLIDHAQLYLRHGAIVNFKNKDGKTPMSAACGAKDGDRNGRLEICRLLLQNGADPETQDQQERRPLHHACREAEHQLVDLLLASHVDVNAADYNGVTALSCVLQTAELHRDKSPHLIVRTLLNHGARCVCPEAFGKVLRCCSGLPEIIALLYNSYRNPRVCSNWKREVPEDVMQSHQSFYTTFFGLSGSVRSLQHLCRFALRRQFGSLCHHVIPLLSAPKPIEDYLLLINGEELF